ncbi:MAG: hypothetical protein IJN45_08840 [Alistipes sp.]|nr:hypothetical protein [Alistipes sp.]MBQ6989234.1 hypothetical protein [Alistipes sp.]
MKKEALDALKAKYPGVSEAILSRIADKIAKTAKTQEEVTAAVEGVTFQQVLESYGDSRATEAQQTAVTNYEKKHGLKDGKKVETGGEQKPGETGGEGEGNKGGAAGGSDLAAQIAAAIAAEMKPLKDELAAIKGEKTANSRKAALNKVLEGAPEKIRQRYEKDFARMTFNDDEDFNAWIGEITPDVEAITSDFNAKGGVVGRPKGGAAGNGDKENPHLKARIAEREAATTTPAIVGLSTETK